MQTPVRLSGGSGKPSGGRKRQRLILCLDGTWNNRDDNTNVLHHFALVREDEVPDKDGGTIFQRAEYHRGVGTGVLDRVSGGAFGFGLEQNVRDAYNWLVQNFEERDDAGRADEIYIFGFSRGAYTARSLVGFIGRCGLLRRGAPLTVNQLWEQYGILGRQHEERGNRFEKIFGTAPKGIRQISELICDPWRVESFEKARSADSGGSPGAADRVPGQRADDLTETEKLLVRWSRRVRITYLGVYDTVGAMGLDALAIPVLKSKLALHHNMRPTTLIQSCRHALAMDEHRSSFNHTPFVAYVGHETLEERQGADQPAESSQGYDLSEAGTDLTMKQDWQRIRAMWRRKIEQRWFVGAHSNVGGGYADNRLAQRPFEWVLEGAVKAGLVCEDILTPPPLADPLPKVRDSFAEFAKPFWTTLFRAKRYYRPINPQPDRRATPRNAKRAEKSGYVLESINEQVDSSVFEYWTAKQRPPNLAEYAKRKLKEDPTALENSPVHPWLESNVGAYMVLVLWAALAALGIAAIREIVRGEHGTPNSLIWVLGAAAFVFALVDWGESKANFSLAAGSASACKQAFLDSIYWTRAFGVVFCIAGALAAFHHLAILGWNEEDFRGSWGKASAVMTRWWPVVLGAGLGACAANLFDRRVPKSRFVAASVAFLGGAAGIAGAIVMLLFVACFAGLVLAPVFNFGKIHSDPSASNAAFAGELLLLQLSAMYLLKALSWCGEPMTKAGLGSILPLQFCPTPRSVQKRLDLWCHRLTGRLHLQSGQPPAAECSMSRTVSESLWRDIIGLIPVYLLVLGFGAWFASKTLEWEWLRNEVHFGFVTVPLWLVLPVATALADLIEDFLHLHFLKLHTEDRVPLMVATGLAFVMSLLKGIGFISATLLILAGIAVGSWSGIVSVEQLGWRGPLAFAISLSAVAIVVLILCAYIYQLVKKHVVKR